MSRSRMFLPMVALLTLVAIIACSEQPAQVAARAPYVTDLATALERAGEKNQLTLLDFYTDW